MNEQTIKSLISAERSKLPSKKVFLNEKIDIGQIRLVESLDSNLSSRYVLILRANLIHKTATVVLLSNLVNLSTDRDYIVKKEIASTVFDFAIFQDFQSEVDFLQLENSEIFGKLCNICCKSFYLDLSPSSNYFDETKHGHKRIENGNYPVQISDYVWNYRNFEFELLQQICPEIESDILSEREFDFLSAYSTMHEFIMESTEVFNVSNILSLQDSSLDLIRC